MATVASTPSVSSVIRFSSDYISNIPRHKGEPHFAPLAKQGMVILEDSFKPTGRTGFVFPAVGRPGRTLFDGMVNEALDEVANRRGLYR